jgi:hypothetical protein
MISENVKINLRFDQELRRRVEEEARASQRSMNSEIVWRLRNSLKRTANETTES